MLKVLQPERASPSPAEIAALAGTGPRYTSYPPATEFGPMAPARIDTELAHLGAEAVPVGLYVHVPFCRSLCWYCGCNVIPSREPARGETYVESVLTEIRELRRRLGARLPLAELALGGGSPNFLSASALAALMGGIAEAFVIDERTRASIELDPRTTTDAQVAAMAMLGFASASVGVQDFSPLVQDAIHRHQSVAQTAGLIASMRVEGFDDVNVDLVYGLPHQTEASIAVTVAHVVDMAPDRIALFGYAHLPERLPHQRLVEAAGPLPDATARAALSQSASRQLVDAGYVAVGLDHFARPNSGLARAAAEGRLARSFQGYVERRAEATLGIGVSSISSTPRLHWQAPSRLESWEAAVAEGVVPLARGVVCDDDDRLRGEVIEALMCYGEVDLDTIGARHQIDASTYFAAELSTLEAGPLVIREGGRLATTALGRALIRNVCRTFDRYAQASTARFSSTV